MQPVHHSVQQSRCPAGLQEKVRMTPDRWSSLWAISAVKVFTCFLWGSKTLCMSDQKPPVGSSWQSYLFLGWIIIYKWSRRAEQEAYKQPVTQLCLSAPVLWCYDNVTPTHNLKSLEMKVGYSVLHDLLVAGTDARLIQQENRAVESSPLWFISASLLNISVQFCFKSVLHFLMLLAEGCQIHPQSRCFMIKSCFFFPHPEDLRRNSLPTGCSKLNEVCSSFAFRHISASSAYLFVIAVQRILNRPAEVICQILQALFKWHKVEQTSTNIFALRCSVSWQFSQTLWSEKCYMSICWIQRDRTEQMFQTQ